MATVAAVCRVIMEVVANHDGGNTDDSAGGGKIGWGDSILGDRDRSNSGDSSNGVGSWRRKRQEWWEY